MPYKTFLKQFLLFVCELRTFDTPKKVENEELKITYETKMKLKNNILTISIVNHVNQKQNIVLNVMERVESVKHVQMIMY